MGIINARFSSVCKRCGSDIVVGSQINWTRGERSTHVTCPTRIKAESKPKDSTPTIDIAPWTAHEKQEPCKRQYLHDATGETRRYTRAPSLRSSSTAVAPESCVYTVVAQSAWYESAEMNEDAGDMSGPGWQITLYLRAATELEIAADEARRLPAKRLAAAKLERAALVTLIRTTGARPDKADPNGEKLCEQSGGSGGYFDRFWIEPADPRQAPSAEEVAAAEATHAARSLALTEAVAALTAWTSANLPADAAYRRFNGGCAPHDGVIYSSDLATLGALRPEYDTLLGRYQALAYTASDESVHRTSARLRELQRAADLASYPRSIWLDRYNGADGDNWSGNNIGGAAIGWRVDWTPELDARLRAIASA